MTGLEFLSATIGQLIWPVLIVVLIFVFKSQIQQIAASPRLKRLKAGPGGIEVEFKEELEEAKKELEEAGSLKALPGPEGSLQDASDFYVDMQRLAELSPRAVVMEAAVRLEGVLRSALMETSDDPRTSRQSMGPMSRQALKNGLLTPQEASVLDELNHLRNRVAHEPDHAISSTNALAYVELATQLAIAIKLASGDTILDGPAL
ncbi:hypothetical protein [Nocardioides marmotae]|uniref:hypothetical protein n=1 Tax=Nocardioides marmotae TaxID=2663857 RepID=UPI0012B5A7C1|nr:hypothetical protein [Nocardioides marmotae]MBC9734495.1 hypothetical protein [Nocardioides marmotae]MTB85595.1 hypothetical protein [Nocardioides marmotae]